AFEDIEGWGANMAGFRTGRRLVWIPLVIAPGATTLTGCKKTIHAVKPLTNISQAPTASSSAAATPASVSPASATANTPSAVASLSATAVPVATPSAKAGAGCNLVPLAAVASALGVASITSSTEAVTTLRAPIIAHQGCRYVAGAAGAGWDLNTFSAPPPPALIAAEAAKIPGAKATTIDGLPAFTAPIPGVTPEEEVSVYKGSQSLVIISHGKTGASVAIAQLILAAI
ncbi:MAG TPA: hypothetical protein VGD55_02830, partial [Acidothermaceae bacterium]